MSTLLVNIIKHQIPYRFEIKLANVLFEMEVNYNPQSDFFAIDLYRNKELLVYGEKLIYGVPLFRDVADRRFPAVTLTPLDESGKETEVNWKTLGETVFLYMDGDV
ncbi:MULTISPECIES: phage baseplate plug family protein [unclassified Paenibacillus]|uniref:phage baseplate plug family protein n=1 Tax=unclassified Paenibacillus TaxID=185978 RepID=UPI0036308BCD